MASAILPAAPRASPARTRRAATMAAGATAATADGRPVSHPAMLTSLHRSPRMQASAQQPPSATSGTIATIAPAPTSAFRRTALVSASPSEKAAMSPRPLQPLSATAGVSACQQGRPQRVHRRLLTEKSPLELDVSVDEAVALGDGAPLELVVALPERGHRCHRRRAAPAGRGRITTRGSMAGRGDCARNSGTGQQGRGTGRQAARDASRNQPTTSTSCSRCDGRGARVFARTTAWEALQAPHAVAPRAQPSRQSRGRGWRSSCRCRCRCCCCRCCPWRGITHASLADLQARRARLCLPVVLDKPRPGAAGGQRCARG